MRIAWFFPALLLIVGLGPPAQLTLNQRLIVACHRVDIDGAILALRAGADVNGRFGDGDDMLLQDPWSLGWPGCAKNWTPLIALASASDYPNPPREVQNTAEDLTWAHRLKREVPQTQVTQRRRAQLKIARLLLALKAELDLHDGYGGTPLHEAIYLKKVELAKLLLRCNPEVNTREQAYIDGPGDITPLHRAAFSAELTRLLLEHGADPEAQDSGGRTPADWAQYSDDPEVARLYESLNRLTMATPTRK